MDPHEWKRAMKYAYRADRHAYREARRAMRWGWWASPLRALSSAVIGGLLIVYLGCLLFLASAGVTPLVTWSNFWAYFVLGLGAAMFFGGVVHNIIGPWHFHFGGIIVGLILCVIGLAGISATIAGWSVYMIIGLIVLAGLLVIVAGIRRYVTMPAEHKD